MGAPSIFYSVQFVVSDPACATGCTD